jgi:hypothetical protein
MYKPQNIKGALLRFALAALFFYWAWDHWIQISALEAGQGVKVKMWAPLAWVYNQGGNWSAVAKWTGQIGTVMMGIGSLVWAGSDLRPVRRGGTARQA